MSTELTANLRRLGLTAHILASVGWAGATAVTVVLAIIGARSEDATTMHAAYLALQWTVWLVIVPASFASLITGVAQAWGTTWGLLRHYWVIVKLVVTVPAIALLFVHTGPIASAVAGATIAALRTKLIVDAMAAFALLTFLTGFSIYKPKGVIPRPA